MDKTVPPGAALLLDFIAVPESGSRYDVLFGNHERDLSQPITSMTMAALAVVQKSLGKKYGSSAAGRYQFMLDTLTSLPAFFKPTDVFTPDLQDRLGYELLKRRGYSSFMARKIDIPTFGLHLAQEWASFPVLTACQGARRRVARGETYYAGDRLNRALVTPEKVEAILKLAEAKAA